MSGPTYADISVVVDRSYSRSSGKTSLEATIVTSAGRAARRMSASRRSCAGLA